MGIKRIVDTDFWDDEKVIELFSPEDKLFFLYLLTNPHTRQLGVYPVAVKTMAFEIGYSPDVVKVLLERFEKKYKLIRRNWDTGEIAIKNYLRHSIVKGGKPVLDLLKKEAEQVKDKNLVVYVCRAASHSNNDTVRSFTELYITNDNDNENENEDSWYESGDESYDDSSKTPQPSGKVKPVRHKYGEYNNVLLTDEQLEKLKNEFPDDWAERIERVSEYQASTGKPYKDYLATIRSWARKDKEHGSVKQSAGRNPGAAEKANEWAYLDDLI